MAAVETLQINFYLLKNEGGSCTIKEKEDELYLGGLNVDANVRYRGYGKDLIETAKELSNKLQKPIVLFIGAYKDRPLNDLQLMMLYKKLGFTLFFKNYGIVWWMCYTPKSEKSSVSIMVQ